MGDEYEYSSNGEGGRSESSFRDIGRTEGNVVGARYSNGVGVADLDDGGDGEDDGEGEASDIASGPTLPFLPVE